MRCWLVMLVMGVLLMGRFSCNNLHCLERTNVRYDMVYQTNSITGYQRINERPCHDKHNSSSSSITSTSIMPHIHSHDQLYPLHHDHVDLRPNQTNQPHSSRQTRSPGNTLTRCRICVIVSRRSRARARPRTRGRARARTRTGCSRRSA